MQSNTALGIVEFLLLGAATGVSATAIHVIRQVNRGVTYPKALRDSMTRHPAGNALPQQDPVGDAERTVAGLNHALADLELAIAELRLENKVTADALTRLEGSVALLPTVPKQRSGW